MHQPPDAYVLIFRKGGQTVRYCRLSPGFPGCFPFVVDSPTERLLAVLRALVPYRRPEKAILKLTFWDSAVAQACRRAGLRLDYELLRSCPKPGAAPPLDGVARRRPRYAVRALRLDPHGPRGAR